MLDLAKTLALIVLAAMSIEAVDVLKEANSTLHYYIPNRVITQYLEATITAYNPVPEQTDDRPLETASGTTLSDHTAACPSSVPFGTKIEIDGRRYICEDRMHARYRSGNYFDIAMFDERDAIEFGRQKKVVAIYHQR